LWFDESVLLGISEYWWSYRTHRTFWMVSAPTSSISTRSISSTTP